jgi:tetratricopeptide (TPR) repeat protein
MVLDPDEPETYLNRGSALIRREDAANAIAMFDQAIQRNTRRPELAYYGRALANELSGNVRAAYRDYRRASELAPRWSEPRIELRRFRVTRN